MRISDLVFSIDVDTVQLSLISCTTYCSVSCLRLYLLQTQVRLQAGTRMGDTIEVLISIVGDTNCDDTNRTQIKSIRLMNRIIHLKVAFVGEWEQKFAQVA